jgi:hypothetical protein
MADRLNFCCAPSSTAPMMGSFLRAQSPVRLILEISPFPATLYAAMPLRLAVERVTASKSIGGGAVAEAASPH